MCLLCCWAFCPDWYISPSSCWALCDVIFLCQLSGNSSGGGAYICLHLVQLCRSRQAASLLTKTPGGSLPAFWSLSSLPGSRPRSARPLFQLLLGILRDRKSPQAHSFPPEIPNSLAVILSLGFPVLVSRCWPSPRGLTSPYVFHGAHGLTWIWFPVSTNSDLAQMGQNDWNWCWKRRSLSSWNPRVLDIF